MKKIIICILISLVLVGCKNNAAINNSDQLFQEDVLLFADSKQEIDIDEVINQANINNEERCYKSLDFNVFKQWLKIDNNQRNLFSYSQISSLKNKKSQNPVSRNQALEDIDTMFNIIKYAYGPYHYMGGDEFFDSLKEDLKNKVTEENYTYIDFKNLVLDTMRNIVDNHFTIAGESLGRLSDEFKQYYYSTRFTFTLENEDFYLIDENGRKYYYQGCLKNENAQIKPTLLSDGSIKYCLALLENSDIIEKNDSLILKTEDGDSITYDFIWRENVDKDKGDARFNKDIVDGVLYIELNNFDMSYTSNLTRYADSANDAKNARAVIIDFRSNGGGGHSYTEKWIKTFTGVNARYSTWFYNKHTYLNSNENGNYQDVGSYIAKYAKNDIPVFVLVDKNCGSATETSIDLLRSIENVILVGSNTGGALLSGGSTSVYLSNSGLEIGIPRDFAVRFDDDMPEAKGIEPDIYCSATESLNAVYALLGCDYYDDSQKVDPYYCKDVYKENISLKVNDKYYYESDEIELGENSIIEVLDSKRNVIKNYQMSVSDSIVNANINNENKIELHIPDRIENTCLQLEVNKSNYYFNIKNLDYGYISLRVGADDLYSGETTHNLGSGGYGINYNNSPLVDDIGIFVEPETVKARVENGHKLLVSFTEYDSEFKITLNHKNKDYIFYFVNDNAKENPDTISIQVFDREVQPNEYLGKFDNGGFAVKYRGQPLIDGGYEVSFDNPDVEFQTNGSALILQIPQSVLKTTMTVTYQGKEYKFYYER